MLDCAIQTNDCLFLSRKNQLFLYVRGKSSVGKTYVIKTLEFKFSFLKQFYELVIMASTGAAANNISRSIIYMALSINKNGKTSNKV